MILLGFGLLQEYGKVGGVIIEFIKRAYMRVVAVIGEWAMR